MKNVKQIIFATVFAFAVTVSALAVPATPHPIKVQQPDGSELIISLHGDEHFSYATTDGVLVARDETGFFRYATMDSEGMITLLEPLATGNKLKSATQRTAMSQATTLEQIRAMNISVEGRAENHRAAFKTATSKSTRKTTATGERGIAILVNFSDNSFSLSNPQQQFTNMLNQQGYSGFGATGSARDYFISVSDSAFQPTFDVYGPYTLSRPMAYYGANSGGSGTDTRPDQMISDACTAANADVDFSLYDTDNDGYVDNVYVFYAGYAESSGAPTNTVWPHRWVVSSRPRFDGVTIYDYACSSELSGTSGSTMDGVGTFCHEFSHVLGLPDFYNSSTGNTTLQYWDIMDMGCYLNEGRTPAGYSAYERFFAGWMTPTEINTTGSYTLGALATTNEAFLISQNGNHNLNGASPNSSQFYMLENRQYVGWDAYLPGHGMLITRVTYSQSSWENNTANNGSPLGIDIIRADGTASYNNLPGDPFPGTSNVTSYSPLTSSGTSYNKPLTSITETGGMVWFNFMNYIGVDVNRIEKSDITIVSHSDGWRISLPNSDSYTMTIFNLQGQLCHTTLLSDISTDVSSSGMQKGIYIVRIENNVTHQIYSDKIINF